MKKLFSFLTFSFLVLALVLPSSVFAAEHEWFTTDISNMGSVDSDSGGLNLIAGNSTNAVYISNDSGATWNTHTVGPSGGGPRKVASDAAGLNLFVGSGASGLVYRSEDGGETWNELDPSNGVVEYWNDVASDDDGSNLIVVSNDAIFTSSNGGDAWVERNATSTPINIVSVDSDSDGSNLTIGTFSGFIYTSNDSGVTWEERRPEADTPRIWNAVASDADGSNLIVASENGYIHISEDGGSTWNETQPTGFHEAPGWRTVASDASGTNLIAGVVGGRIYSSDDGGDTWFEERPAGDNNYNWTAAVSDTDGSNLVVARSDGALYITPAPLALSSFSPEDNQTEVSLNTNLSLVFNKAIATSTGDITLHLASDDSVVETIDVVGPKVTLSDTDTLTIDLDTELELGTEYYVLIDPGAIEDLSGSPFAGISDPTTWNFTSDATPLVSALTPADNAVDFTRINNNYEIGVTFDQNVVVGTGNITLHKTSDDSVVETFDVTNGSAVEFSGSTVYLLSAVTLDYNTEYYFLVPAGAVEDESGNTFAGISDPTTWSFTTKVQASVILDDTFITGDGFNGTVSSLAVQDDGKILVGGSFSAYDGDTTNYIARLNTDGSLDDTFITGDGFDGTVYSLAVQDDGKILVGGSFSAYDGDTTNYIARLNTDGSLDDTFVTGDGFDGEALSVVLDSDGKILIGGDFGTYDGDTTNYIARLNTDGSLDDTFITGDGFDNPVDDIVLGSDEKILVGGEFESYDGDATGYGIVRLNADGSLDDTFMTGDGFGAYVAALAVDADEKILVGGQFSTYDGDGANYIARLNTDGSLDDTFVTGDGFDSDVYTLAIDADGKILVGGSFSAYDGDTTNYIARLNTDGSLDDTFITGDGFNGTVSSLAVQDDGKILVGGSFSAYDGDTTNYIARLIPPAVEDEETPAEEEETNGGGGSHSSHRSGGGGSGATTGGGSDLLTLLRSLIQQFIDAGGTPTPTMLAFVNGPTTTGGDLNLNSEGPDVTKLQSFLITQNKGPQALALGLVGATGFFGPLTQAALAEYQASVGITPASGYFGPITRAYLISIGAWN